MEKLLKNCLDTLYLPPFLNKSGVYYATSRNGCYCTRSRCNCHQQQPQHQKLEERRESSAAASAKMKMWDWERRNFTDQRQMYEDCHEKHLLRTSRNEMGIFVPSVGARGGSSEAECWDDNAILDSELDIDTLYELCEFRERNATECMSLSNRLRFRRKNRPNKFGVGHKCLHRYRVDEKLQPMPRLANARGESLCEICGGISKYLREHTVDEIISRDPHMGGKEAPVVVLEMPTV